MKIILRKTPTKPNYNAKGYPYEIFIESEKPINSKVARVIQHHKKRGGHSGCYLTLERAKESLKLMLTQLSK